jgi:hypothetical protein
MQNPSNTEAFVRITTPMACNTHKNMEMLRKTKSSVFAREHVVYKSIANDIAKKNETYTMLIGHEISRITKITNNTSSQKNKSLKI